MKRRFRYYIRQGWSIVEVPRTNLYDFEVSVDFGNMKHYKEIRTWCNERFAPNTWEGTMHGDSGTSKPGIKRFAFKNSEDATFFTLQWL